MQSRGGSTGSDALSHVYIQNPPIRCNIPESNGLFYDDGTKLLLSPSSDQILSWKIGASSQPNTPPNSDFISERGETVLTVRFSLDLKLIAIQRSGFEIEFVVRENGLSVSKKCKSDEKILGFFWTDTPTCDVIVVKSTGIEMLFYESDTNNFHLIESKKTNVNWYKYSHESRMLLLASSMQSNIISSYQFSNAAGIVKLPKFEMNVTKSESNSKPVLSSDDVHIITVYGRIYCLQFDKVTMELNLYRFYRDAVLHQGNIQVYSSKIAISTVDNIILIHQLDSKVLLLYDLFLDNYAPISAPLPLTIRGVSGINENNNNNDDYYNNNNDYVYNEGWSFLTPDLICDVDRGLVWKLFLDLDAIAASSSDIPFILQFLQRRRSDPSKIKELCLAITRGVIVERREVCVISEGMEVVLASYSQSMRSTRESTVGTQITTAQSESSGTVPSGVSVHSDGDDGQDQISPHHQGENVGEEALNAYVSQHINHVNVAISPDEMYKFVFEMIEEQFSEDPSYLISVILEFLKSASREKLKVNPNFYKLLIQLLTRANHHSDIILFVSNKIIEPSKEVALQLYESAPQNSKIRKMGLDMLRLLSLHHDYVSFLLKDGFYLEALRYARKYKVITVQPALFLEAAMESNKIMHLAAVMRFFTDFAPNFKSTLDFGKYQHILSELS
ncbi:hypothetical protein LUZ60_005617 [Juncus effusus]|nr:hypothetical protein LUZ60_005617 [Juncus effusus]